MSWREHTYQPVWKRGIQPRRLSVSARHLVFSGVLLASLSLLFYAFRPAKQVAEIVIPGDILTNKKFETIKGPGDSDVWLERANAVRNGFLHVYHGYEQYAFPKDEMRPLTKNGSNTWNGWGVTVFDSLDTLQLMGLDAELERAIKVVEKTNFRQVQTRDGLIPFFETVIRYLGGLLSAYALSKRAIFLTKADELARVIAPVFSSESGLPGFGNFPKDHTLILGTGLLAEISSMQMEYLYLAKVTGKKEHYERVQTVNSVLARADMEATGGMLPSGWNVVGGLPWTDAVGVGAAADSAHEYLLKQYLMTAKTDKRSLEMYLRMTTHVITHLLYITPTRRLLYVTDITPTGQATHHFGHLACFFPGLLALGAHTLPLDNLTSLGIDMASIHRGGIASDSFAEIKDFSLRELHMWAAEGLAQTCYTTYRDMPTGLGAEEMVMTIPKRGEGEKWITALWGWNNEGRNTDVPGMGPLPKPVIYSETETQFGTGKGRDYKLRRSDYLLRPETIESLHIMWKVTGDIKWREWGWEIFKSIEKHCKTPIGYSSIRFVDGEPTQMDDLPSYFFAETLKYLFLLFSDSDPISLDKWVFNTEAHPFPVFEWTDREKRTFGLL